MALLEHQPRWAKRICLTPGLENIREIREGDRKIFMKIKNVSS